MRITVFPRPMLNRLWAFTLGFSLALLSALTTAAPPVEASTKAAENRVFPQISLPGRANGERAISQLGLKLPDVAAFYNLSPSEFRRMLREDNTAWIDMKGRLLFIEPLLEQASGSESSAPAAATIPLEETFTLHSRPGASRVLYLDFDGHLTSGTQWNVSYNTALIDSPPYSTDSDPAFSNVELAYIQDMWRQVAEDYAPFNIDVTTEEPGSAAIVRSGSGDEFYGTRMVVTDDNFADCGCGGFAYVGVFDNIGSDYKPAFVFNTGLVGAGEAITHEAGHNLGLRHDGTSSVGYYQGHGAGATGWAPIMGVGYYQKLVQWSSGEYTDANNSENDLVLIQNNGAPLMSDDHSDSSGNATALAASSDGTTATVSGSGLVHSRLDLDVFSFISGAGAYTINVDPASYSPNLDILAELYDSSGTLVASSNPIDSLPASLSGTLSSGEYYLNISGVGKGSPTGTGYSDYGSLGRYSILGSVPGTTSLASPIAVANFTTPGYTPGPAGTTIGFDGAASSDPDGDDAQLTWNWTFGTEANGSGEYTSHAFVTAGTHTVTLTVTDIDGLTNSDSLTVDVLNTDPTAVITVNTSSGEAPVTVNFDGSLSADNDGSIASYSWQFGDGTNSTAQSPSHTYTTWGSLTATLTVTDNLGASDSATQLIEISQPPFIDQVATADLAVTGTVTGSYLSTHDNDSASQSIRERESGGKKQSRYSYLEHVWIFDVQPGEAITLSVSGYQSASSDNDQMEISYRLPGQSNYLAPIITLNTSPTLHSYSLPPSTSGEVRVRVRDSDRSAGNRSLDTVYIDQVKIRTNTSSGGVVVTAPSWVSTEATVSSVALVWSDNSNNEDGFNLERSLDNSNWAAIANPSAGSTSYSDSGLNPGTLYYYRVRASSGETNSGWAVTSAQTLDDNPVGEISLTANGYKVKGRQTVELNWSPADDVIIYRDGGQIGGNPQSGSSYLDSLNTRGGGTYRYQVCVAPELSTCSAEIAVVF